MATSPCNKDKSELVPRVNEVPKIDTAVYYGHNPFFSLDNFVHVSDQKVVPHHLVLPRLMLLNRPRVPAQEEIMSVYIGVIRLRMVHIQISALVHVAPIFLAILLSDFPHNIFLQTPSKVIRVTKVKARIDLHLHEIVKIPVLVISVLRGSMPEHRYQLHIFHAVNRVSQDLTDPFA